MGVTIRQKHILRFVAIHDARITIRIAIYSLEILLLKEDKLKTKTSICILNVALQPVNIAFHDAAEVTTSIVTIDKIKARNHLC
jgi:hypothetical protein